jgi:hypothetical protein
LSFFWYILSIIYELVTTKEYTDSLPNVKAHQLQKCQYPSNCIAFYFNAAR